MKFARLKTAFSAVLLALVLACAPLLSACNEASNGNVTITYVTGVEGLTINSVTTKAGSKIYPPADPEREGYRFEYWEEGGQEFIFDRMPDKDITLTAKWTKLYLLSFETGENAETVESAYYAAGETIEVPDTLSRPHYKFTGWTADGAAFDSAVMPQKDLTLTASWVDAYTITFNTGVNGITVAPISDVAGAPITAPAINRKGYYVKYWKLDNGDRFNFDVMPDRNVTLTAVWEELTNLPAMFIDLNNVPLSTVNRKDYVESKITITNTKDEYLLNNVASEFRGRGNGSWVGAGGKNGYKIKFNKKQSLFGREANKHWVVIACTNFDDPTMYRNYLAYNMAGEVFTDIEYSTSAHWLDLYVNGEYRGVYLLCEHVRVGKGRVDIESEYTTEPEHNGFLVEYDAYGAEENPDKGEINLQEGINYFRVAGLKYPFTVKSPDPEDYAEEGIETTAFREQVAYIKDYVTKVYNAALAKDYNTFAEYADTKSFVDMYILHELFKNMDTGFSSFFLYKKPDGKLYAGPPWDFDATTTADDGNDRGDRTPQGLYVADPNRTGSAHTKSELYISLYQIPTFKNAVTARWKVLSPEITAFLDKEMNLQVYTANKAAMGKNYAKWKNKTQTTAANDWVNDCKTLRTWFADRIAWLDNEWK